jgi:hypothetical protein
MTDDELATAIKAANDAVNAIPIRDWLARGEAMAHLKSLRTIQQQRAASNLAEG